MCRARLAAAPATDAPPPELEEMCHVIAGAITTTLGKLGITLRVASRYQGAPAIHFEMAAHVKARDAARAMEKNAIFNGDIDRAELAVEVLKFARVATVILWRVSIGANTMTTMTTMYECTHQAIGLMLRAVESVELWEGLARYERLLRQ